MTDATAAISEEQPRSNIREVLKAYIERAERLNEEIKTMNDDKRDLFAEAKGNGFDVNALKTIIKLRRMDPNERAERDTITETYMQAIGMV